MAHLRVTPLSCFSFLLFHFSFFVFSLSCFLLFCFIFSNMFDCWHEVSEFNFGCFLRSRCSMEKWCLHDIGLDSWDWVGPPTWKRACFNSPRVEWRLLPLLTRSLPRLFCCCCCFRRPQDPRSATTWSMCEIHRRVTHEQNPLSNQRNEEYGNVPRSHLPKATNS